MDEGLSAGCYDNSMDEGLSAGCYDKACYYFAKPLPPPRSSLAGTKNRDLLTRPALRMLKSFELAFCKLI